MMNPVPECARWKYVNVKELLGENIVRSAMENSLLKVKKRHPTLDLTDGVENMEPSRFGDIEGFLIQLPCHRYCPICKREHDDPQNCI